MLAAINHITTISSTDKGLAAATLLLVAAAMISLLAVHVLDRGVNPISMAVSDYGARSHAWFYRLAAVWLGLAGLLTAVMLADSMFPKPTATILFLLLFAAARWAITIFPTDIEREEQTSIGRSHFALAVLGFAAFAFAAGLFAPAIERDPFWSGSYDLFNVLGWLVPLVAILTALARRFTPQFFGAVERLYYLCMFGWLAAVALVVLGG